MIFCSFWKKFRPVCIRSMVIKFSIALVTWSPPSVRLYIRNKLTSFDSHTLTLILSLSLFHSFFLTHSLYLSVSLSYSLCVSHTLSLSLSFLLFSTRLNKFVSPPHTQLATDRRWQRQQQQQQQHQQQQQKQPEQQLEGSIGERAKSKSNWILIPH